MKVNIYVVLGALLILLILTNRSPYATTDTIQVPFIENNIRTIRDLPVYLTNLSGKEYLQVRNVKITTPVTNIRSIKDTLSGCAKICNSTTECKGFTRINTDGPNKPSTCTLVQNFIPTGQMPVFTSATNMNIFLKTGGST